MKVNLFLWEDEAATLEAERGVTITPHHDIKGEDGSYLYVVEGPGLTEVDTSGRYATARVGNRLVGWDRLTRERAWIDTDLAD